MRLFRCQSCGQVLHFENTRCERCGHALGFLPAPATLSALERDGRAWRALAQPEGRFRYCANADHDACNWLVPARSSEALCRSCRHNRTVPDLAVPENLVPWRRWETAKRRLVYTLQKLQLPLPDRTQDPVRGLAFDVLADPPVGAPVMTGHAEGLITLALPEADDAERERRRAAMGEPYRTLLGHVRHESGHFYWERLVHDGGRLEPFRALFGDERQDYAAALARHHAEGRRRTGNRTSSAPMRPHTPGRISPNPGRTGCTCSTRWRWRIRCASRSTRVSTRTARCRPISASTPMPRPISRACWSTGCR